MSVSEAVDQSAPDAGFNRRQERILEIVRAKGFATIDSLAEEFSISAQTIRRDVIRLDEAGLLQRFHGGAGLRESDPIRLGYGPKREMHVSSKERIGLLAASLIEQHSSIYLDVGTTVEAVARALADHDLRAVYTNSMASAAILATSRSFETYVSGGLVRGADGSLVGDAAIRSFDAIAVDMAVIACSGFAEDGTPMDFDPQKVAVKQAALRKARRAILVADASKFGRPAVVTVAPLSTFTAIVTDRPPAATLEAQFQKMGVSVVVAN